MANHKVRIVEKKEVELIVDMNPKSNDNEKLLDFQDKYLIGDFIVMNEKFLSYEVDTIELSEERISDSVSRDQFMDAFRHSDSLAESLTPDDRIEIFLNVLQGGEDITKELIQELLKTYDRDVKYIQ